MVTNEGDKDKRQASWTVHRQPPRDRDQRRSAVPGACSIGPVNSGPRV
jgi:hypothetical protein